MIGDSNSYGTNNNFQRMYDPVYYSRLVIKNGNSQRLSVNYSGGLMRIELGRPSGQGETYKVEVDQTMYLSPMKAHLLTSELNNFLEYRKNEENIDPNKAFGVNGGMNAKVSFIAFSTNEDREVILTIGKFDDKGVITESSTFKFSVDFNYSLEWDDLASNTITKVYNNDADIILLKNAIEDFSRSSNGAYGYNNHDVARYETSKLNRRIDQVFDKLGIDRANYSNGGRTYSNNNFLNNATSKSTSYEELENLLD